MTRLELMLTIKTFFWKVMIMLMLVYFWLSEFVKGFLYWDTTGTCAETHTDTDDNESWRMIMMINDVNDQQWYYFYYNILFCMILDSCSCGEETNINIELEANVKNQEPVSKWIIKSSIINESMNDQTDHDQSQSWVMSQSHDSWVHECEIVGRWDELKKKLSAIQRYLRPRHGYVSMY